MQARQTLGSGRASQGGRFGLRVVSATQIRFVRSHPTKQGQLELSRRALRPQQDPLANGGWRATRPQAASRRARPPVQLEPRPSWPCPCRGVLSPQKAFLPSGLHPSHRGRPFHAGHGDESGGRGPGPSEAVGTVSVTPSTSPLDFPLGSQETEVKVAAGALGAGRPESRWVSVSRRHQGRLDGRGERVD